MEKQYNLVLKQNDIDENVLKKDDASIAYIIYQNNNILSKYEEIKKDNEELKKECTELEEDIERLEKSKVFLQGLAKNYSIISNNHLSIQKYYKQKLFYILTYMTVVHIYSMFYLLFQFMDVTIFPLVFLQLSAGAYIFVKYVFHVPEYVKKAKHETQSIEKSNDHITDLIDNA